MRNIEIMSPAGNWESLQAAIQAGCNSIYFGVEQLNMRARSTNNFTIDDLKKICSHCKEAKIKSYLTLNTILYDHDMQLMKKIIDAAKEAGITAIIISDLAALQYCKEKGITCHISTQANISNIETIKFFSLFADVMVLARELTLQQVASIVKGIEEENICGPSGQHVRIEIFAHGALCVAVSGKCYMSLHTYNSSANRGACLQNCRRSYIVTDKETGEELEIDNEYIMSPKDLCTIDFLDKVLATGVNVLKIEGRARPPEYVYTVTKCYREASDAVLKGEYTPEKIKKWKEELSTVFNRGLWEGYYLGKKLGEWSGAYGSKATKTKIYKGSVINWYAQPKVAAVYLDAGDLVVGDEILITGVTTGVIQTTVNGIFQDEKAAIVGKQNNIVTFPIEQKVRVKDKVYVLKSKEDVKE
ncbi:MAG: peptidase U32 family protein [bacterium]|nr:peptidase U32 family protein [bacterium]